MYFGFCNPTGPYEGASTNDLSGKLRITRIGSIGTAYYWGTGGWVSLIDGEVSTNDLGLGFGVVSREEQFGGELVHVAFENLTVNQGELVCPVVCGNGVPQGFEECDDGNPVAGDGCSATCQIEPCFVCSGEPSVCTPFSPACGNGCVEPGETCGEPSLPACPGAQACVECQCMDQGCASLGLVCPETVVPGGTGTVDITINVGSQPLGAYSIDLTWDASVLRLDSVRGGTTVEFGGAPTQNIDNAAGIASVAATQSIRLDGPTGVVHVASLDFTVLGASGEMATVTLGVDSLFDTDGLPIAECAPADGDSCTIEVRGLCGDVNDDTEVNIGDALAVAQFDVGLRDCYEPPFVLPEVCDINPQPPFGPDGNCNIGDALKMAQCDVGLVGCDFECDPFVCSELARAAAQSYTTQVPGIPAALVDLVVAPENPLAGSTFTGEVTIDVGERPLGSYSLALICDEAILQIVPPAAGGATPEFSGQPTQNIEDCRVNLAAFQASRLDGPTGTVSVATVTLRARDTATSGTATVIGLQVNSLFDTDGLTVSTQDAEIPIEIGSVRTPTPTATPEIPPCVGDCDRDREVRISELITGVNIALGLRNMADCPAFDADGDGTVSIAELIKAVKAALNECVEG